MVFAILNLFSWLGSLWSEMYKDMFVCFKLFSWGKNISRKYILAYCCNLQRSALFTRVYFGRPECANLQICLWVSFPSMFAVEMISIWSLPVQKSGSHDLFRSVRKIKMWPKHHCASYKGTLWPSLRTCGKLGVKQNDMHKNLDLILSRY